MGRESPEVCCLGVWGLGFILFLKWGMSVGGCLSSLSDPYLCHAVCLGCLDISDTEMSSQWWTGPVFDQVVYFSDWAHIFIGKHGVEGVSI